MLAKIFVSLIKLINIKIAFIILAALVLLILSPIWSSITALIGGLIGLIATILNFVLLIVTKILGGLSLIFSSVIQLLTLIINGFGAMVFFLLDKILLMINSAFGLIGSFFGFLNTVIGYLIQHFILRYTNVGIFPPIITDILKSILGCFGFGKKFFKQLEKISNSLTKSLRFNLGSVTKNFKRKLF